MNPPWPRRIVLTRTALLAPGKTTTSPALTSPAKTRSSTDDDNTVGVDGLHPYRERDMYGMCTTGETRRPAESDGAASGPPPPALREALVPGRIRIPERIV